MKKHIVFFLLLLLTSGNALLSQNTVGVLSYDGSKAFPGYNFIYPAGQPNVYLLDNCGRVVHCWEDDAGFVPGNSVYLMENGDIIKTKRSSSIAGDPIWAGGGGAIVERRDWDNNLLWSFEQNDAVFRLHHDIEPLPNGNILMIVWEYKSMAEAMAAGRDTSLLSEGELWPDAIWEVKPIGSDSFDIVWEWHAWDHLIQNYDSAAPDFGNIIQYPERIDLNYDGTGSGEADWMHANAIDYNASLDQIAISVPEFDEIWIIDHSTTTAQAAGHTGGLGKRGGDLLFRWGNPITYGQGDPTDQMLYYQHDVQWITEGIPANDPDFGKLMVFNNRLPGDYSTVNIIAPTFVTYDWRYETTGGAYLPTTFDWTYSSTPPEAIYSNILSSGQRLPNGNTLIGVGRPGYAQEIDGSGAVVWEFKNPISNGNAVSQGDSVALSSNMMFRVKRYPLDHPAFAGRDLSPGDPLEMNGDTSLCAQLALDAPPPAEERFDLYPNPASETLHLRRSSPKPVQAELLNMVGQVLRREVLRGFEPELDLRGLPSGIYLFRMEGAAARRVVID